MNQQYPKAVLTWADDQLVDSGNHCRLIDSFSKKIISNLIQFGIARFCESLFVPSFLGE
jgi:hypothetical protein